MVRAKVAALAAAEPDLSAADRDGARGSARRHLELAAALQLEATRPALARAVRATGVRQVVAGARLHELAGWPHVATDVVRKQLAGLEPHEPARPEHYTEAFSQRTYAALHERAAAATAAGAKLVLLDGNFPTPAHRAAVAAAARRSGAAVTFVHVAVDPATAATRAAARRTRPCERQRRRSGGDRGPPRVVRAASSRRGPRRAGRRRRPPESRRSCRICSPIASGRSRDH
jgi:predicted kinase